MRWKAVIVISLLVAAGWAENSGDASQSVPPRSPFARPTPAMRAKAVAQAKDAALAAKSGVAAAAPAAGDKASQATVKPVGAITTKPAPPPPLPKPEAAEPRKAVNARDPFISPIQMESVQPGCAAGGKRCLVIDKIALQGVVRTESGFIAVVVNSANRTFFLRENDPLWNGYVLRITSNAVTFKEASKDRMGRPTTREVTKTLGRPAA
jgi:hypothetical protein